MYACTYVCYLANFWLICVYIRENIYAYIRSFKGYMCVYMRENIYAYIR